MVRDFKIEKQRKYVEKEEKKEDKEVQKKNETKPVIANMTQKGNETKLT